MTPDLSQSPPRSESRTHRAELLRAVMVTTAQVAALLALGYYSANWPGYPPTSWSRAMTRLILAGWPLALAFSAALGAGLLWAERRVRARASQGLETEQGSKFSKVFVPPAVPTVAVSALLVWVSSIVVLAIMIGRAGEDASMFLILGLSFGTIVWGTLTFAFGLLVRAVVVRLFKG